MPEPLEAGLLPPGQSTDTFSTAPVTSLSWDLWYLVYNSVSYKLYSWKEGKKVSKK